MIPHSSPTIEEDDIRLVADTLKNKKLACGEITASFIETLKNFFAAKNIVLTSSGTSAIARGLRLLNLTKNDEVIVPAYVCKSVAEAVLIAGATPKVVDINDSDYNISYKATVEKMTPNTKAIILPHMFGDPVRDIDTFLKLGIPIIEDIAQSIGGSFKGRKLGTFTEIAMCSFYATKMITTGVGGALIINSKKFSDKAIKKISDFKMPDFQSALGLSQLNKIDSLIKRRRSIAKQYIEGLKGTPNVKLPEYREDCFFYRFIVEISDAKKINKGVRSFNNSGIKMERYTDTVLEYLKLDYDDFPSTKKAMKHVLSIPIYPSLAENKVHYIIRRAKKIFKGLQ